MLLNVGKITLGLVLALLLFFISVLWLFNTPDQSVEELAKKWAKPPSQFIDVDGLKIHLRDEGPKEDPVPIVLLHGTSSSLHTWQAWTEQLVSQKRVIRFDMAGFGLTGPHPQNDYKIESYAKTVVQVLDQLGVSNAILAGNSLGAYVAWSSAVLYPNRVKALILLDASGLPYESKSVPLAFKIASNPFLSFIFDDFLPRSLVEKSLQNVYSNPSLVSPELVEQYFDLTTREGNRDALSERFKQTMPGGLANRLQEIKVPTLLLWGANDALIPPKLGQRFNQEIENSRFVILDNLGHVPHEEDPKATLTITREFLAENGF